MLERELYEHYQIDLEQALNIGDDMIIKGSGNHYLLRNIASLDKRRILEQERMTQFLMTQQEPDIITPLKSTSGHERTIIDGQEAIIYQFQDEQINRNSNETERSIGKRLARFHLRGEHFEPTSSVWQGTWLSWKNRWMKRLDQLEKWYVHKQQEHYKSEMDESFLLTFPYFLTVTENAIQMIVDTQLNDPFSIREGRGNTICHRRFYEGSWITLDEKAVARYKVPADFVYDHFSRDVAEYLRHICTETIPFAQKIKRIERFLHRYQMIRPLKNHDAILVVTRIMFPVHYFDLIEAYYRSVDERRKSVMEEDLMSLFTQAEEYETLLHHISKFFLIPNEFFPHWLAKK
ncbi:spore coat putative kinase YutH [Salipaludibacillus sp. HK11]|uniref:spore coat putative kinase YutH n=1 Tax=Salipaludibacillus sp. HK11 TaxID=3394320 RepID=UPI0039FBB587